MTHRRDSPLHTAVSDTEQSSLASLPPLASLRPLVSHLRTGLNEVAILDEVAIRRMWANIDTRPQAAQRNSLSTSHPGHWLIPAFSAALFVFAFFVTTRLWDNRAALAVSAGSNSAELSQGIKTDIANRQITFADGSQINLGASSSLRVLSNGGGSFVTKLDRGSAIFHVTPGGPRRWIVEAGDVTVEVVGTVFSVDRDGRGTSVSVERGIVLVRGQVPGGEVRLTQGQQVDTRTTNLRLSAEIDLPSKKPIALRHHESQKSDSSISLSELKDEEPSPVLETDGATTEGGLSPEEQQPGAAVPRGAVVLQSAGVRLDPSQLSLDELLHQADEARRQGDSETAASYFYLVSLRAGQADTKRGIAALSFARVSSDQGAIVRTLIRGLQTMPPSLREPALARLVRAAQKTENGALATKYARIYLKEFPLGPRVELVKSWAELP